MGRETYEPPFDEKDVKMIAHLVDLGKWLSDMRGSVTGKGFCILP